MMDMPKPKLSGLALASHQESGAERRVSEMKMHSPIQKTPHSPAHSAISTHCGGSPGPFRRSTVCDMLSATSACSLELAENMERVRTLSFERIVSTPPGLQEMRKPFNVPERDVPSAESETDRDVTPGEHAHKKFKAAGVAPIRCKKAKGDHQPTVENGPRPLVCKKTQKIIDEAHHFGLCDHYAKLMDTAKEIGFDNVKWPTNFTLFHLAAKKNNARFIEWLVANDFDDLHTIDDFGHKPIDYACPKKRDSVHGILSALMACKTAPDTPEEHKYQAIKAGTWVDPKKLEKKEKKKVNCMAEILQSADIALGDVPNAKKQDNVMSAYEAEMVVPAEYKKCFKTMSNGGGWQAMEGHWPHQGTTVLHWAARNGKEELCQFLVLEYGADPRQEDGSGHDAMYHAKLKRHRKLAKKLFLKFVEPKKAGKGKK